MIALVWRFEVRDVERAAFEAAYGPDGGWARLFARGAGYMGTQLLRNADGSYLTIDRWHSHADFTAFLDRFGADYEALDRETEALTRCETRIGEFEVIG
jgi:heme-degrading monooxygenase HmoA